MIIYAICSVHDRRPFISYLARTAAACREILIATDGERTANEPHYQPVPHKLERVP